MISHRFSLNIPAERYQSLYAGSARDVIAVSEQGVRVRFPGKSLHRFITHSGIQGVFEIRCEQVPQGTQQGSQTTSTQMASPKTPITRMVSIEKIV